MNQFLNAFLQLVIQLHAKPLENQLPFPLLINGDVKGFDNLNMGLNKLIALSVLPLVLLAIIAYAPGLLDINPVYVSLSPMKSTAELKPSMELDKAIRLLEGLLPKPEAIAVYKGDLYTGLKNGWIVRIRNENIIEPIGRTGDPNCESWDEDKCGRPLGLRIDDNGMLYVADPDRGVYSFDVNTGERKTIIDNTQLIDGKSAKFFDDLDINSKTGDIYVSDASTKFSLKNIVYEFIENAPNGRILHHNLFTNVTRTLLHGFAFPNGIQLSPKKDFLIFSETFRNRVMKYHLEGKSKGKLEVFVDGLPGGPDNIRSNGKDGYWIAIALPNINQEVDLVKVLGPYPMIRRIIGRLLHIVKSSISFLNTFFNSKTLEKLAVYPDLASFASTYGLVIEVNKDGDIVRSFHAPMGTVHSVTHVMQVGNVLYTASLFDEFVGKLDLS